MLHVTNNNNWSTRLVQPGEASMTRGVELYSAMSVGERIRITRLAIGITQRAFAHPLGITREAQTQYESGSRHPKGEHAVGMCDAWGLTMDWLFRGDISGLQPGLAAKINKNIHKARTHIV